MSDTSNIFFDYWGLVRTVTIVLLCSAISTALARYVVHPPDFVFEALIRQSVVAPLSVMFVYWKIQYPLSFILAYLIFAELILFSQDRFGLQLSPLAVLI